MDKDEHIRRHKLLHKMLDELVADWINQTNCLPSQNSVMDLMQWSHQQTIEPTEIESCQSLEKSPS